MTKYHKHPFVDGNKRVAAQAAIVLALQNGFECLATPDELVAIALETARGSLDVEALAI
jgi:death-on-curing family protein